MSFETILSVFASLPLGHGFGINTNIFETFYHINGFIEGEYKKYWNSIDKIKILCQFVNGKLHGYFRDYDFNGNIIKEYMFDSGKISETRLL